MKLIEEYVEVVNELDEHLDSFATPRKELAGTVILRLEKVLGRSGIETISNDTIPDRARHKPDVDPTVTGNCIVSETLSSGFAIGPERSGKRSYG